MPCRADDVRRLGEFTTLLGLKPWETAPWDLGLDGPCPHPPSSAGAASWEPARRLRQKMLATEQGRAILKEADAIERRWLAAHRGEFGS